MAGPCKIEIIFSGADHKVSEGLGETYHLNSVADVDTALGIANNYAEWRRTFLARGLFISTLRASMIADPIISASITISIEGNSTGTGGNLNRDQLTSGFLIKCQTLDRAYKGNRIYRGFPDGYVQYDAAGQEVEAGLFGTFLNALLTKTVTLGLALKSLSKDPAIAKPKVISAVTVVAGHITDITAVGAGAEAQYGVGERITVTGAKGSGGYAVNGVYRIMAKAGDVLSIFPQPATSQGFVYVGGSARTALRIPSYPTIARGDLVRYASRQVGKKSSGRRGRYARVK